MVTEDGKPIDFVTGRPILGRTNSSTSLTQIHGKEIEQEEGELHKWGLLVQRTEGYLPRHVYAERKTRYKAGEGGISWLRRNGEYR